jgi:hypothetical protein
LVWDGEQPILISKRSFTSNGAVAIWVGICLARSPV